MYFKKELKKLDKKIPVIHFWNEPFLAIVEEYGKKFVLCKPIIYDEPDIFGIAVVFKKNICLRWGLIAPRDMITAWRATEVIRRLSFINIKILESAYYAVSRQPFIGKSSHIEKVTSLIGKDLYDAIMLTPVPEKLIQAMLTEQDTDYPPDLFPITDEVRAGTISWRQEFSDAGVEHPDDADIRLEAKRQLLEKHSKCLESYAVLRQISMDSDLMKYVEKALADIVEMGYDKKCNDRLLIAMSGVIGELRMAENSKPLNEELSDEQILKLQDESIIISASWLIKNPLKGIRYTKDSADRILRRHLVEISEQYYQQCME